MIGFLPAPVHPVVYWPDTVTHKMVINAKEEKPVIKTEAKTMACFFKCIGKMISKGYIIMAVGDIIKITAYYEWIGALSSVVNKLIDFSGTIDCPVFQFAYEALQFAFIIAGIFVGIQGDTHGIQVDIVYAHCILINFQIDIDAIIPGIFLEKQCSPV